MFCEEYIKFSKKIYFRPFSVIPDQSFGSHIRPQPSGLGLNCRLIAARLQTTVQLAVRGQIGLQADNGFNLQADCSQTADCSPVTGLT